MWPSFESHGWLLLCTCLGIVALHRWGVCRRVKTEVLVSRGVLAVFTTNLSISSFGENFSVGSILQFSMWIASWKWSGHIFGSLSHSVACQLSSPISGAHRCASMYRSSLFMPLTNPLTQGEYTDVICCLMPHFMQFSWLCCCWSVAHHCSWRFLVVHMCCRCCQATCLWFLHYLLSWTCHPRHVVRMCWGISPLCGNRLFQLVAKGNPPQVAQMGGVSWWVGGVHGDVCYRNSYNVHSQGQLWQLTGWALDYVSCLVVRFWYYLDANVHFFRVPLSPAELPPPVWCIPALTFLWLLFLLRCTIVCHLQSCSGVPSVVLSSVSIGFCCFLSPLVHQWHSGRGVLAWIIHVERSFWVRGLCGRRRTLGLPSFPSLGWPCIHCCHHCPSLFLYCLLMPSAMFVTPGTCQTSMMLCARTLLHHLAWVANSLSFISTSLSAWQSVSTSTGYPLMISENLSKECFSAANLSRNSLYFSSIVDVCFEVKAIGCSLNTTLPPRRLVMIFCDRTPANASMQPSVVNMKGVLSYRGAESTGLDTSWAFRAMNVFVCSGVYDSLELVCLHDPLVRLLFCASWYVHLAEYISEGCFKPCVSLYEVPEVAC